MKTYEETVRAVLAGRDERLKQKQRKTTLLKRTAIPLACGTAAILIGIGAFRLGRLPLGAPRLPEQCGAVPTAPAISPAQDGAAGTEAYAPGWSETPSEGRTVQAPEETGTSEGPVTTPAAPPETTKTPDEGNYGGPSGGQTGHYVRIPVLPQNLEIVAVGERITDEEAAAYFAGRKGALAQTLSACGVPADDIRISEKGYGHVCYAGVEGERLEMRENFRDYLVYNGDTLVAIVTLSKENGRLFDTPAFGAPWFADYAAFLNAHRGEELVYVYAGLAEIILTPDGGMYSALSGIVPEWYLEGVENPYRVFYHPDAVFVP